MQFKVEAFFKSMFAWTEDIDTTEEIVGVMLMLAAVFLFGFFINEGLNKCCKSEKRKSAAPMVDVEMQTPPQFVTSRH